MNWARTACAAAVALLALGAAGTTAAQPAPELAAARTATEQRDFAAALPLYAGLLARDPANVDLLIEAARVHGFADRNAEAAALYRRALAAAPARRADILPSLAWQTLWSHAPADALPLFDELSRSGADRADAFDGLGQTRLALDDAEGAQAAFREALALRPGDAALQQRLARALLWADRTDEAAAVLQALLQQRPGDRDVAWTLANVRNFGGLHRAALADFGRLGPPRNDGERFDVARAWNWAGYEDRAAPLLAGQSDREAVWLRDWRVGRELAPFVFGTLEHAVDSDSLESTVAVLGGAIRVQPGSTLEVRARHQALADPYGSPTGKDLQAYYRWRTGEPGSPAGTFWPTLGLRASQRDDWSPVTGLLRTTWVPQDLWRVDAEFSRELIETPQALAERVTVDVLSVGADHRVSTRLLATAAVASLRFDDGNQRVRLNGRVEYALQMKPRWTAGVEAMAFESSLPTGPDVPARGYWNPERYSEARIFTSWTWEQRPWDVQARLGLGTSSETDGFGNHSTGTPNQWELAIGHDISASLRARLTVGGSGSGMGLASGGSGYWRRAAGISIVGWF